MGGSGGALTFHLHTHSLGHSAVAPPTRITPTNTSSAALEPRPTPTPVIGRPCSSWYTHAHSLARAHARTQRRPPSHRHGSLMAGGDADGVRLTSGGEHRGRRGCGKAVWRGGRMLRRGDSHPRPACVLSVRPLAVWPAEGHKRGALPLRRLTLAGRYVH